MDRINGADFIDLGGGKRGFRDEDLPTGVAGTEVTADWLNSAQEEILGIIETSGLVPNAADRAQLAKAIQSGRLNYVVGGGTANAITGTLTPAPSAYSAGMRITLKVATPNTDAVTLNLNGLGAKNILTSDGSALAAGDLNGISILVYDGTSFRLDTITVATETVRGVVELASATEAAAGTDLTRPASVGRMAAAVQAGAWSFANAANVGNAYTAALSPAPTSYKVGMLITLWVATANTNSVTLNLNGLGAQPVTNADGGALAANDFQGIVTLFYAGSSFVKINIASANEFRTGTARFATAAEMSAGTALALMASVGRIAAAVQAGTWIFAGAAAGTANALTCTLVPSPPSFINGRTIILSVSTPNTGPATLDIGFGAQPIVDSTIAPLQAGDLNGIVALTQSTSGWILGNIRTDSELVRGSVRLATSAETNAGTDLSRPASVGRMAQAVQGSSWNYAVAGGSANALTAALVPALTSYNGVRQVTLLPSATNAAGAVTINLNGLGNIPVSLRGSTSIPQGALKAGIPATITIVGNVAYLNASFGSFIGTQIFNTVGTFTYTETPGTALRIVEGCGAGAAGAGAPITGAGFTTAGAGGSSGSWGRRLIIGSLAPQTVIIGAPGSGVAGANGQAGGSTSFGSLMTLPGGPGGTIGGNYNSPQSSGASFRGTDPTGVDYGAAGSGSYAGFAFAAAAIGGAGGSGPYGMGGIATGFNGTQSLPGADATGYGAGGGGAIGINSGVANPGGKGSQGILIVHEYAGT